MLLQMTRPVQAGIRQERKLEIIANHLANVTTNGFKADILSFNHRFKAKLTTDYRQGDLHQTGNKLDFGINGEGFFKIMTPQGIRYTRNGNFTRNSEGILVNHNGHPVQGVGGDIAIQGANVFVNEAGEIQVDGAVVGQLQIVSFNDLNVLQKEADSMFVNKSQAEEIVPDRISLKQGVLENANISSVTEMTKMIETHRMYETVQKVIQSFDETDEKVINEVGRSI